MRNDPRDDAVIWYLRKGAQWADAIMSPFACGRQQLRYRIDGRTYYARAYNEGEGARLLEDARAMRADLEQDGWKME